MTIGLSSQPGHDRILDPVEGELTPDERAEYEEIIEKTDLLGILKSLSRRVLAQ